jgi:uncharacterized protein (TIGR01777 family)
MDSLAGKRVVVTGASGLVGRRLVEELAKCGCDPIRAVRRPVRNPASELYWSLDPGEIDSGKIAQADALVHLAGENIADHRWTSAFKERIRDSRINGTRLISETLAREWAGDGSKTLLCASAIGYYGDRGEEVLTESSTPGGDFLAGVCQQWEESCTPAVRAGVRVVNTRIGVVLSPDGGALKKMLRPFKFGLGGPVGDGRQYMSWIALSDVVGAMAFILGTAAVRGPVNLVAPHPVTNAQFAKTLGRVLHRPSLATLPAFAARLAFGEMADALLLSSTRVVPQALSAAGYRFQHSELEPALRRLLGH